MGLPEGSLTHHSRVLLTASDGVQQLKFAAQFSQSRAALMFECRSAGARLGPMVSSRKPARADRLQQWPRSKALRASAYVFPFIRGRPCCCANVLGVAELAPGDQ